MSGLKFRAEGTKMSFGENGFDPYPLGSGKLLRSTPISRSADDIERFRFRAFL